MSRISFAVISSWCCTRSCRPPFRSEHSAAPVRPRVPPSGHRVSQSTQPRRIRPIPGLSAYLPTSQGTQLRSWSMLELVCRAPRASMPSNISVSLAVYQAYVSRACAAASRDARAAARVANCPCLLSTAANADSAAACTMAMSVPCAIATTAAAARPAAAAASAAGVRAPDAAARAPATAAAASSASVLLAGATQ